MNSMRHNAGQVRVPCPSTGPHIPSWHWRVRSAPRLVAVLALALAFACSDEPAAPPVLEPATLSIVQPNVPTLAVGETTRIAVEVRDQYGQVVEEPAVAWSSQDARVAQVGPEGVVTGVAPGTARITATAGGTASSTVQVSVSDPQYAVLVALYLSTRPPEGWTREDNWGGDGPLEDWYGVETDSAGRVTGLDLSDNNLVGAIPPELGDLDHLKTLNLGSNRLMGGIPPQLGGLAALEMLLLGGNPLSGPLPLPLKELSSLSTFDYEDTDLCVPDNESFKAWLESIQDHRGSGVECAPPDRDILVAFYEATHGPEWVNSDNWLTDAPLAEWHGVSTDDSGRVDSLSLNRNGLTGPIPTALGGLSNLVVLDLEANDLTDSIPTELGNLTHLENLILRTNRLTGRIPPELGQLSRLEDLNLSANTLTGRIPPELGKLSELEFLWLSYNELTGPIPPELGQLSELQRLWLSHNEFDGDVPVELGDMGSLAWLLIGDNPLDGPLPLSLKELSLGVFGYDDTDLCVPNDASFRAWLDSIPAHQGTGVDCPITDTDRDILVALHDSTGGANWSNNTNWVSDQPIGEWHGVTTDSDGRVTQLLLTANNLTGAIPAELGSLARLRLLDLSSNDLTRAIPAELGSLANLDTLSLSDNELTGTIPPELGNLSNLANLKLSDNDLEGSIPAEFGGLDSLTFLLVNDNPLSGPLPLELNGLPLDEFHYHGTDLCVPADSSFQAWLNAIPNHNGTGVNCTAGIRLDFDDPSELDGWRQSSTTTAEIRDGILELGSSESGRLAWVSKSDVFDPPIADWTARARMGRADTRAYPTLWLETNHTRYSYYLLQLGSGVALGPAGAQVDTNWRIYFYDEDRHGPGDGGWFYFPGWGYGTSSAVNDLVNEFTDMTLALSGDSLRVLAGDELLFGATLPTTIRDAGATAIQGVWMVFWFRTNTATGTALFDWIDIGGDDSGGANAVSASWRRGSPMADKAAIGDARPVRIPGNRR